MTKPPLGKVEAFFIFEVCFATPSPRDTTTATCLTRHHAGCPVGRLLQNSVVEVAENWMEIVENGFVDLFS